MKLSYLIDLYDLDGHDDRLIAILTAGQEWLEERAPAQPESPTSWPICWVRRAAFEPPFRLSASHKDIDQYGHENSRQSD